METTRFDRRRLLIGAAGAAGALALGDSVGAAPGSRRAPAVLRHQDRAKTIRIALNGSRDAADRRQALIPPFQEKFPGVEVEYIPIQARDWGDYFSKVLTMIAAGDIPDISFVDTSGIQLFAAQGLATPLDPYVTRDQAALAEYFADVHPTLVEAMMYEGNLYELPIDFNAANLYLNMPLVREAGFDYPAADWSREQFYEMAKGITDKTDAFGFGWTIRLWGSWTPWMNAHDSDWLQYGTAPGGEWLWDAFYKDNPAAAGRGGGLRWDAPTANTPENIEALEFVVSLTKEGIAPTPEIGGGGSLQGFFTSNKLGMNPAGGFWAGGLHEAGMAPGTFDVQYWPKWTSQRHHFGTAGYVLMKDAVDPDLSWEYIKYLTSIEAMTTELAGNFSTPTRRSMMTAERYAETGPEHWQVFYDTLDRADTRAFPAPPEHNQLETIFNKYSSLAGSGESSPKDALDNMQREMEAIYAQRTG